MVLAFLITVWFIILLLFAGVFILTWAVSFWLIVLILIPFAMVRWAVGASKPSSTP